jgi:hypothetical protein
MAETTVALWFRRYMQSDYMLCDGEDMAAGVGAAMREDGGAVITGIQFPDGRTVEAENWAAFQAAVRERDRAVVEAPAAPPARPVRRVRDPFRGDTVDIFGAGEPPWLGKPLEDES